MPKKLTPKGKAAPPPKAEDSGVAPPPRDSLTHRVAEAGEVRLPEARGKANYYIRNIRNIPVALRLSGTTNRRIELNPRGNRKDLTSVTEEELYDEILLSNLGLTHEIVSGDEARDIISKQYTNAAEGSSANPLMAILRDQNDNPIEKVTLDKSNTDQAITVGRIEETEGNNVQSKGEQITRVEPRDVHPKRVAAPGTVDNPIPIVPESVSPENVAELLAQQDPQLLVDLLKELAERKKS